MRLFEDNAKETGLVGVPVTLASVVREKFAWKEIAPAVTTFVIAALLFWQGLDNRPLLAAVYGFGVVAVLTLVSAVADYWSGRGKTRWRLSQKSAGNQSNVVSSRGDQLLLVR